MIVINGGNLVQSFFFISGFLNSIVLLDYVAKKNVRGFTVLLKTFAYRVVRFFPVLLFLVIMNATFLIRFDSGPFWNKFNYLERQACRENMWTNFLFINNYISGDMKCMVHTWFISADLHLSLIATGLLLLVVK
jgi:peptidoglycan/LPS O-acetylase OafA/YrhL